MTEEEQAQKDQQTLHIAGLAQQLLGNPLWEQVFTLLREKYLNNLIKTKRSQADVREGLYVKYLALGEVEAELTEVVKSGTIVEKRQEIADYQAAVVEEAED